MYFYFLLVPLLVKSLFLVGTAIYAVQDSRLSFQLPYTTTRNSLLETHVEPRLTMIYAGEIVGNTPPFMDFNMLQYYDTPDGLVLIHSTGSDSFVLAYSFNKRYVNAVTGERELALINLRQDSGFSAVFNTPNWER